VSKQSDWFFVIENIQVKFAKCEQRFVSENDFETKLKGYLLIMEFLCSFACSMQSIKNLDQHTYVNQISLT